MNLGFIVPAGVLAIGLGIWHYIVSRPEPVPPPAPRPFVWAVEMSGLTGIQVGLPRRGLSEAWRMREDRYWYFTDPDGPQVDSSRWGGGVPLLPSGPGANRLIEEAPTAEQLTAFGLDEPQMLIDLQPGDGVELEILVGDSTPDGISHHTKQAGRPEVFAVDSVWFKVIERLVTDPPHPPPDQPDA